MPISKAPSVKVSDSRFSLKKAAFFVLFVGDVHGIEDRLDAAVGAPHRHREADEETYAECVVVLPRQRLQLPTDDIEAAAWQKPAEIGHMVGYGRRVGDKSVQRHECGQRLKEARKARAKTTPAGNQHDAVPRQPHDQTRDPISFQATAPNSDGRSALRPRSFAGSNSFSPERSFTPSTFWWGVGFTRAP